MIQNTQFTEKDILKEMDFAFDNLMGTTLSDGNTRYDFFLDLEDTRFEIAGSKIHLYADSVNWAVVFEINGYNTSGGAPGIQLDYVGNCIEYDVSFYDQTRSVYTNMFTVMLMDHEDITYMRGHPTGLSVVRKDIDAIKIRGEWVTFKNDYRELEKMGIQILTDHDYNPEKLIDFGALFRYLFEIQPEKLWAKENEIKEHLKVDIPKLMEIDKFHFSSDYNKSNPPSNQELFQLIARILVTRDPSLWQPTEEPNNHWSNWESGTM